MRERSGFFFTVTAYFLWGGFPAFFVLLSAVNPFETVAWRTFWSFVFAAVVVVLSGKWSQVREVLRTPKTFWYLALAGLLLFNNWTFFVIATVTEHILETSLGYFINPFVTIALGMIFLKERLTALQWIALSIAAAAVLQLSIAYGEPPWFAIILALSFGLYGFVKKQHAKHVDASVGMTVETLAVLPLALILLGLVFLFTGEFVFFQGDISLSILLILSGPVTVFPLMLFAAGTKRLKLIYVGFIQFLTPTLYFLFAYFVMNEPMSLSRWIGFIIIWVAITVLIIDFVLRMRRPHEHPPAVATVT